MFKHFVLLAALAIVLLLAWWWTCTRVVPKKPIDRLYIALNEGIALVRLPAAYEIEDMGVLWEFLQGNEAAANRARVHSLLYDCSAWRWSNVLGREMVLWQDEADWLGDTLFCQVSPEMKPVLDGLLQGEENRLTLRPFLYFATVKEGLTYARSKRT